MDLCIKAPRMYYNIAVEEVQKTKRQFFPDNLLITNFTNSFIPSSSYKEYSRRLGASVLPYKALQRFHRCQPHTPPPTFSTFFHFEYDLAKEE